MQADQRACDHHSCAPGRFPKKGNPQNRMREVLTCDGYNNQTLTQAHIDPELGIEAQSFDTTINRMNRIQEAVVWGGD